GSMRQKIAMLVYRAPLHQRLRPHQPERLLQPRRAVDSNELGRLQPARDQVVEQRAPGRLALPAHVAHRQQELWPSRRTPNTASNEIDVALRSSRTRTTVPSRMSRT